ncbi:hypothetical protein [Mesorhizobium humile]|uniref:Uncharacterized protein n=2 Tax=Mesorhizobium TaxID=68287 RepID=A0ABU4YLL5_9HYPH|nr:MULTISPECIES: hypothetical protein [unclassified Mesorhizobium]MDX8462366.1 hypothetical protein [Mesorhizobium sp. VK2D]MDX8487566.1 hypothetical protein [Mesorhizobium sp. VK2B]
MGAGTTLVLVVGKGIVRSVSLGHWGNGIGDLDRGQQMSDFQAGQAVGGLAKCVSDCLQL